MNTFKFTDTNKRYHTLSYHYKQKFGKKVIKISLNGGFTCPNIDGSKGTGGCIYCSENGSGDFGGDPEKPLEVQFSELRERLRDKWNDAFYIAYLQANTNTYAPLEHLKKLYKSILAIENVVGIAISTRADCITEEIADYLAELSEKTYLTVELGLQTIHDKTAEYINRCHTYSDFLHGYNLLQSRKINTCIHIINGLPFETHGMMMETAKEVARLHPHSVKIHLLHIIKDTVLADIYAHGDFMQMEMDDYVNTVVSQLEIMPEDVIIQRLTGDGDRKTLIAPLWSMNKKAVMNAIDKEFVRRNSVQGIYQ